MDDVQKRSVEFFRHVARTRPGAAEIAGRSTADDASEPRIVDDIFRKLAFRPGDRILDLGCGAGRLPELLVSRLPAPAVIHLVDIPEMIDVLRGQSWLRDRTDLVLFSGVFPGDLQDWTPPADGYDRILAYSVVQYTAEPGRFIELAVDRLAPGGRLLVGDLPNVDKKGRFLASAAGRALEASYRGIPIEHVPIFHTHRDYVQSDYCHQNPAICDALISGTVARYRTLGYDAFVLPQPETLPYSRTREDLLIVRPPA
jgi:trans-aconitate methyltransferase